MRWEYLVEAGASPSDLGRRGAEGWDLVAVVPTYASNQFYFKRPIREPARDDDCETSSTVVFTDAQSH